MICDAASFEFRPPPEVSRARRVLIKPSAAYPVPHPVTVSRETLCAVIEGIRRISDADILVVEGPTVSQKTHEVFRALGYDFPRITVLDVRDCMCVEVENPLPKPFALPTIWVPNVVLWSDYLISVSSYKILGSFGNFTLRNLIGLLPPSKYGGETNQGRAALHQLGLANVVADLYYTVPFDLGIIDARYKLTSTTDPTSGTIEPWGKVFVGTPLDVDSEASQVANLTTPYLQLIREAKCTVT